ncbi:hypothetical protein [Actinocrispum wychmicini]|nr:hypothetical protein [Actinocrispum wychmicini]
MPISTAFTIVQRGLIAAVPYVLGALALALRAAPGKDPTSGALTSDSVAREGSG